MKFNLSTPQITEPTLNDVLVNQFFVTFDNKLCQKVTNTSYNVISYAKDVTFANSRRDSSLLASCTQSGHRDSSLLASCTQSGHRDMPINRICPHVHSIDF